MTSWGKLLRDFLPPGDLAGLASLFMDDKPLLKVSATEDEIRFDPARWFDRWKYRATLFGKKLGHSSFKIAGWRHRPYSGKEWAFLEKLYDWGNETGETSFRPRREWGIDVLDWPIIMTKSDQRFPRAFALLAEWLGPKRQIISVKEFNRRGKEALWQVLQAQRNEGAVDPELQAATHWSN